MTSNPPSPEHRRQVLAAVLALWEATPGNTHLRLGQLLSTLKLSSAGLTGAGNTNTPDRDVFYLRDEDVIRAAQGVTHA